jgi:hypothetical protein
LVNYFDLNPERRIEMSEPIILDGGGTMVTIQLPASFKQETPEGHFSVSPEPTNEPFQRIVVTDKVTGEVFLNHLLSDGRKWIIEIK